MKIYLDTNIIIDLYDGKYRDIYDALNKLRNEGLLHLPFSSTHIEEIGEYEITDRLNFLSSLTSDLYFQNDMDSTQFVSKHPSVVYDTLNYSSTKFDYRAFIANMIPYNIVKTGRNLLDLDPQYLNNIKPSDAIKEIDKFLAKSAPKYAPNYSGEISIIGLMKKGLEISESSHQGFSYHTQISKKESYMIEMIIVSIFSLLDSCGFWSDKKSTYSKGSMYGDAIHCFNGAYCNYIISNDLRFCNKSSAVFENLGIDTKVFHLQNDINEIVKTLKIAT